MQDPSNLFEPVRMDWDLLIGWALFMLATLDLMLLWIGIAEARKPRGREELRHVKLSVQASLFTISALIAAMILWQPTRIDPMLFEATIYLTIAFMATLLPIAASDRIREAFIRETPLLNTLVKKPYAGHRAYVRLERLQAVATAIPVSNGLNYSASDHRVQETSSGAVLASQMVEAEETVDPDYERYLEQLSRSTRFYYRLFYRLSYEEFLKVRQAAEKVMGMGVFGMTGDKLDIFSLSVLARLDAGGSVSRWRNYRDGECFRKLREFRLVSERGRLMPRGVKLARELKRAGVMERLREQVP